MALEHLQNLDDDNFEEPSTSKEQEPKATETPSEGNEDEVEDQNIKEEPEGSDDEETDEGSEDEDREGEEAEDDDPSVPFHKHPRFKELVDTKNAQAQEIEDLRRQLEEERAAKAKEPEETKTDDLEIEIPEFESTEDVAKWFLKKAEEIADKKIQEKDRAQTEAERRKLEAEQAVERQLDDGFKKLEEEGKVLDHQERLEVLQTIVEYNAPSVEAAYKIIQDKKEEAKKAKLEGEKVAKRKLS